MTKQKAPVVTKQTVENVGSTVKMSNQVFTSLEENDELHIWAGIKFDTKRMTWVCAETGLVCDQHCRDRSQIADINTARHNSDNLIIGPSETKKATNAESVVSSTTPEKGHDPHIFAGSKNESEETETSSLIGDCVEPEAVHQNEFDMEPDLKNNLQAVGIKNGVVKADNTDTQIHHFSDFEENPKGGLFWKLSEFHRRSGKQGLETRFELLSPTIIVDCSANCRGSDEHDQNTNSSSSPEDLSHTKYSANCGSETVENTHRSEISRTNFAKDEVMECAPADSVSELERGDDTKLRCLRKRKPVVYYPKAYSQPSKTKTDKNEIHSHTVLDWYKETAKMMREFKELETKREDSDPVKICKRKRLNESCRSIRLHKYVKVAQIADYSFHDKSCELNSLPTKSLAFHATLAGTIKTAEDFVINVANEKEHFQDIPIHNNIKESDFDIDSILQELNPKYRYEPSNAVEMKKLCEGKEELSETIGNEPEEVSTGADSCLLSPSYCFVNDEEHSLKVPGNNNKVTCNSADNACTFDNIEDLRRISVLEKETEMTNIYSGSAKNPELPYEEVVSWEDNNIGETSERALRKGLRNLSPVMYFPNRKRRVGNQDRKTSVVRNKKEEKLDSKTNSILDVSGNAQTNSLNVLSENERILEASYYENENSNKENRRKANNSGDRGMENQTKLNQMESLSSFSGGQLECVSQKQNILKNVYDSKVVKTFQKKVNSKRGHKQKRNKRCSNDKFKRCNNATLKMDGNNSKFLGLNPFNEVTNVHTEPLNLSTVLVTDSEKPLSDLLQSDFIAQKRVLRNRSAVSYFPDKLRKQAVKGPCGNNQTCMRSKEMGKKVLLEKEKNSSFVPEIVADKCDAVPQTQACNFQPKSLGSIISAHGHSVGNASTHDQILKSVNCCIHTSDRGKQDIVDNAHDSDISVTDQTEAHQNGIAESVLHPGIEEEKAANVHSALVGLYAAEKIKGRQDRSLIAADFKRRKTEFEPDKFISALQNVSDDHIGVVAEGASSEVEIGSTIDLDDLTCSVNTKESAHNSGEIREGNVTEKSVSCTMLSEITAVHAHTDGSVENASPFVSNNEPGGVEDFALPSVIMEENESRLQTKSAHVEGTEIHENDILDEDQSLTEHRRVSSANTETGNAQNLQIGNAAATKEITSCKIYPVGTVVWGRFSKIRWWPAIVVDGKMLKRETKPGRSWVMWLSDNKVSELKDNLIELFTCQYKQRTDGRLTESMKIGILKALQICADRAELDLSSFQSVEEWGQSPSGYLQLANLINGTDQFPPAEASPLPPFVLEQLGIIIKSMHSDNRVAVIDDNRVNDPNDSNFCPYDSRVVVPDPVAWKRNTAKGKKMQACEDPDGKMCLSCDLLLRDDYQVFQHPLFEGLICRKCKEDMMSSFYAIDDDGCSLFCCICSEGGKLFVCEKELCGRAYCFDCIDRHSEHDLVNQISQTNPWHCFLCTSYSLLTHGSLTPRNDWSLEIVKFFQTDNTPLCNDLDYLTAEKKRKIRVLSLYDGIGTGKLVLNELGLDVEAYYASEINKDAMLVSSVHHDVTHIGDASLLTRAQLIKMCPIDLVIGGPPCNDLSIVNPLRKGFNGTGMLLMKFIYILKDVEALSKGKNHVFWLLENTGSMLTDFKQVVCSLLRMEPAIWDAKYFTGQKRARCFWGNIPGLYSTPEFCKQLQQEKKDLDAALIPNCNRKALVSHTRTITTGTNSLTITNGGDDMPIEMNGVEDRIWVSELERLFGFPDHYTDVGHLSPTIRHKLLGKAWCVPVIKHILSPLKNYFALKET